VVREQIDICRKKRGQTGALRASYAWIIASPKPAVVYEQCIGTPLNRDIDQCLTCGDARDNMGHSLKAFDLQAVWAVVFKRCDPEGGI
jgi:hypothetical protein